MYLLGSARVSVARLGRLRVWAERGLVHIEDASDNSYDSVTWQEALQRVKGLNDMQLRFDGTESAELRARMFEEREKVQSFVDQMLVVIQKAKEQGSPDDPSATHALLNARPKRFVMPSNFTIIN